LFSPRAPRHWRGSVQHGAGEGNEAENTIADRLAQPEGGWRPFVHKGLAALVFPRSSLK